ncbi:MAG: hypothetical protein HZY73_11630 [Micropruina sp.]|nr:MAG: hypothetical protein HZY73_11630 [Micropruina sp.]
MSVEEPRLTPLALPPLIGAILEPQAQGVSFDEASLTLSHDEYDATLCEFTDCAFVRAHAELLKLRRVRFTDVAFESPQLTKFDTARGLWRGVEIRGGSIAVLDVSAGSLENVLFDGVRIGYLNARDARLFDVEFRDCRIGTFDAPGGVATRVRFASSLVDELELRNRVHTDTDLRGIDFVRLSRLDGAESLGGSVVTQDQAHWIGPTLAAALKMVVIGEQEDAS